MFVAAVSLIILSSILCFVLLRKMELIPVSFALGISELLIAIGTMVWLNFRIDLLMLFGFVLVGATTLAYQVFSAYSLKKEGMIRSKMLKLSKKLDKWIGIAIIAAFALVLVVPSLMSPVLVQLSVVLLLTKSLFFEFLKQ